MNQQQKRFPRPVKHECPLPEDGPFEIILYRLHQLEEKMDEIIPKLYQLTGIWGFIKLAGAFILGAAAVAAFAIQHFNILIK